MIIYWTNYKSLSLTILLIFILFWQCLQTVRNAASTKTQRNKLYGLPALLIRKIVYFKQKCDLQVRICILIHVVESS